MAPVSGLSDCSEGITAPAAFIARRGRDCICGGLWEKLSGGTGRQGGGQRFLEGHCRVAVHVLRYSRLSKH